MSNFPSSLDNSTTLPNPTGTSTQASPDHAGLHTNENTSIIAVETKLGIGASTPTNGLLLTGNGAGSSAWSTQAPSGTIVGTTDTQVLTNKTLTSPIINAPTITNANITADSIAGYTSANAGTIYGVSISGGAIVGSNSVNGSSIVANSIPSGAYGLGSITNTAIANSTIAAAKIDWGTLLSLLASGGTEWSEIIGSYSETGTNGTAHYVNIGGLKLAWGITGSLTLSSSIDHSYTITFPASFFSAAPTFIITPTSGPAVSNQFVGISANAAATVSQGSFYLISTTSSSTTATATASWFAIGS